MVCGPLKDHHTLRDFYISVLLKYRGSYQEKMSKKALGGNGKKFRNTAPLGLKEQR